jgi:hypothetical protein
MLEETAESIKDGKKKKQSNGQLAEARKATASLSMLER